MDKRADFGLPDRLQLRHGYGYNFHLVYLFRRCGWANPAAVFRRGLAF